VSIERTDSFDPSSRNAASICPIAVGVSLIRFHLDVANPADWDTCPSGGCRTRQTSFRLSVQRWMIGSAPLHRELSVEHAGSVQPIRLSR